MAVMKLLVGSVLVVAGLAAPVSAQEWVVGLGYQDFSNSAGSDSGALAIEVHAPFKQFGPTTISAAGAVTATGEGDVWVGVGVSGLAPLRDSSWFLEGSLMGGFYEEGTPENDLGGNILFRTLVGVGYVFDAGFSMSLGFAHTSNAGLDDRNPGANALMLRYRRSF